MTSTDSTQTAVIRGSIITAEIYRTLIDSIAMIIVAHFTLWICATLLFYRAHSGLSAAQNNAV